MADDIPISDIVSRIGNVQSEEELDRVYHQLSTPPERSVTAFRVFVRSAYISSSAISLIAIVVMKRAAVGLFIAFVVVSVAMGIYEAERYLHKDTR